MHLRSSIFVFAILISCAVCAASVSAQPAVPAARVAVVNSFLFSDEKDGLVRYVTAVRTINTEMAPVQAELNTMGGRLSGLAKEIEAFRVQAANGKVDERAAQAKVDEAEKLDREFKFKQEEAKIMLAKRQQAILGPVMQDVGRSLNDFAKQKGYSLIFDLAKDNSGLLVGLGDEKLDVTREFIAFYNARNASPK